MRACVMGIMATLLGCGNDSASGPSLLAGVDPTWSELVSLDAMFDRGLLQGLDGWAPEPAAPGPVERVVYLEIEARGSGQDGAHTIEGRATFLPIPRIPEPRRPSEGTCARTKHADDTIRGVRGGFGVTVDYGEPFELAWDPSSALFLGSRGFQVEPSHPQGRDLAWQPVSVASSGSGVWSFESRRAVQFGETPTAWIAERRESGEVVVRWHGTYDREDLVVRVVAAGAEYTCTPGADQVVVPWWALTHADARIEFAATRRQHVLTEAGTLLIGEATIVVPVNEEEALETLSSEQPLRWEETPSRSLGPNRVRRGTRPGSTRSTPS